MKHPFIQALRVELANLTLFPRSNLICGSFVASGTPLREKSQTGRSALLWLIFTLTWALPTRKVRVLFVASGDRH